MNGRWVVVALLLPIAALMGLSFIKYHQRESGREVRLPIQGFDPRDLLSGHYLIYRIDYGATDPCGGWSGKEEAVPQYHFCVDDKIFISGRTHKNSCFPAIAGRCERGRFTADVERFFIPERYAVPLDRAVRNRQGEVILSVKGNTAVVKELLIDGRSWREYGETP